jgi:hypothetical protein
MWSAVWGEAHQWAGLTPEGWAPSRGALAGDSQGTPRREQMATSSVVPFRSNVRCPLPNDCQLSATASLAVLRDSSIRKKIIGPILRTRVVFRSSREGVRNAGGAFALLQKQTRDGGVGLVGQPLIEQCTDFLAQIGGAGQTRKFKALQRVFRGRQQKFPRWLKRPGGQGALHCGDAFVNNNIVTQCQEYGSLMSCGNLWKSRRTASEPTTASCESGAARV